MIAHGHSKEEIGDYPLDAFELLVEAARRLDTRNREALVCDTLAAITVAFSSKKDALEQYLKLLKDKET